MAPSPANTITLGPRTLELRGLRMEHVRRGLLEQMYACTQAMMNGRKGLTPEQVQAHVEIVAASVEDQIDRAEFEKLLNALAPIPGVTLLTSAVGPILQLSGFVTAEPEKGTGEVASPAS